MLLHIGIFLCICVFLNTFIPAFGWFSERVTLVRYGVCHGKKNHENRWETGKKNHSAPLPGSSSLLTLPQGSLATLFFCGAHTYSSRDDAKLLLDRH